MPKEENSPSKKRTILLILALVLLVAAIFLGLNRQEISYDFTIAFSNPYEPTSNPFKDTNPFSYENPLGDAS